MGVARLFIIIVYKNVSNRQGEHWIEIITTNTVAHHNLTVMSSGKSKKAGYSTKTISRWHHRFKAPIKCPLIGIAGVVVHGEAIRLSK
ncbi:hypothetical protein TYRP_021120 [Tyrophagus putrescentiae]|nr:hypothetical protein TYRP_021120 [Tyrophagus putrescentiae]